MDFDRESKATGAQRVVGTADAAAQRPLPEQDYWFAPEVQLSFGPTSLVMLSKAWRHVWKTSYDVRVEALYWFIQHNSRSLLQQSQLASLMRNAQDADEKWTRRQIHLCQNSGYVRLYSADNLPDWASLTNLEPDNRAKYPIPTPLFHKKMVEWAGLKTRVSISVFAKARHYSGNSLPPDAPLPEGLEWDVVAWVRNQLTNGGRK